MPDIAATVRTIDGTLRELGIPQTVEGTGRASATSRWYGVRAPALRREAKRLAREWQDQSADDVIELALQLVSSGVHDLRGFAYEMLAHHKVAFAGLQTTQVEQLGRGMDNWGSVDHFGRTISGQVWREGRLSDARIARWARSNDLWWRRAALVSTIALNEKRHTSTGDPDRTLEICTMLVADHDDMIVKALSWALRALSERDAKAVRRFLRAHDSTLAARVRREVTHKLETGRKN